MSPCTICGRYTPSGWWQNLPQDGACGQVTCMACGTTQCHGNGGAKGTCRHCLYGRLPGWGFVHEAPTCEYKGCNEPAVYAYLPGAKKSCCRVHGQAIVNKQEEKRKKGNRV
jgi:hypothetical protein